MASFTYKDSLERARKAVLDSRSKFAVPDAKETLATVSEGLVRPRARPEEAPVEDTSIYSIGNTLMEALMPKPEAPDESPRPKARPEGDEGPRRPNPPPSLASSFTVSTLLLLY